MRLILCILVMLGAAAGLRGEPAAIDTPVRMQAMTRDGTRLAGGITSYDEEGFELQPPEGAPRRIGWSQLDGRVIYQLHQRLLGRSATAAQWLEVGRLLLSLGDEPWSKAAFDTAVRLDPAAQASIESIRQSAATAAAGEKVWGLLDAQEQSRQVEQLKQFAREAQGRIGNPPLQAFETQYFLFVTDLEAAEARKWNALLDRMYGRLCQMFDIPPRVNVWHGKALVFTFKSRESFLTYERLVEQHDAQGAWGLCHVHGPVVRIAFYRDPDESNFATVLVHESTHGFLHRYRSPRFVPSWINEGLAEWIAYTLVPGTRLGKLRLERSRQELLDRGDTGGMFEAEAIEAWQYGTAYGLTDFMIAQNRAGYVAFIKAVKDGKDWRAAMEEDYGASLEKLVAAYGASVGVANLRP